MNDLQSALTDGLKEREADSGATITWAGGIYPCSGGATVGGKTLEQGGFRMTATCTIVVRLAALGTSRPAEKQILLYKSSADDTGKTLRIDGVTSVLDAALQLECNDPNQGA